MATLSYKLTVDTAALVPTQVKSTLSKAYGTTETTITVADGTNFPSGGGVIQVGNELMTFTGKSTNDLTGVARGAGGTVAQPHYTGDTAYLVREDKFFAASPIAQAATIAAVDTGTVDGTYGAEEAAVIADLRTKLNSVVTALKNAGILAAA